jgi:hypothetical protein
VAPANIDVDPDRMHASGSRITSAAQDLEWRISAFQQHLTGYGDVFGSDVVGSMIAGCYGAISGGAMKCYASNTRALGDQGSRVCRMAGTYQQADSVSTAASNRIREALA